MGSYTIYKDSQGFWRWRFQAENNRIIAVSSESYWNKQDCLHSIGLVKGSTYAPVYEQ